MVTSCGQCRDGAVLRAITLHLLVSSMRPSVDAMHTMLRDGHLIGPQSHLCVRMDASVSVYHPQFWSGSITAETEGGAALVPACLEACVGDVSAGAKAVAMLHAHGQSSREAVLAGGTADPPSFFGCASPFCPLPTSPFPLSMAPWCTSLYSPRGRSP